MRVLLASGDPVALSLLKGLFPRRGGEVVVAAADGRRAAAELLEEGFAARARGDPEDLSRALAEEAPDLLVLSAPAKPGFLHALNGDRVERILRSSGVPTAVARAPLKGPLHHVVVPLDGGEVGRAAIPVVARLGRGLDARVTLVHVNPGGRAHPRWTREWTSIADAERELRASVLPVSTSTRRGRPAREILRACAEERADLLILGTRARLSPARRLLGSVTETLLHAAPIPLVLVPSRAEPALTPEAEPAILRPL